MGEIAIFVRPGSPHYGAEVTIVGPLEVRARIDGRDFGRHFDACYLIDGPFGPTPFGQGQWSATPEWLRKRRPPQDWTKLCNLTDLPREVTCA
jgi:hypothetical protein